MLPPRGQGSAERRAASGTRRWQSMPRAAPAAKQARQEREKVHNLGRCSTEACPITACQANLCLSAMPPRKRACMRSPAARCAGRGESDKQTNTPFVSRGLAGTQHRRAVKHRVLYLGAGAWSPPVRITLQKTLKARQRHGPAEGPRRADPRSACGKHVLKKQERRLRGRPSFSCQPPCVAQASAHRACRRGGVGTLRACNTLGRPCPSKVLGRAHTAPKCSCIAGVQDAKKTG